MIWRALGALMIVVVFVGIFLAMARDIGLRDATRIWLGSLAISAVVVVGALLVSGVGS